MKCTSCAVDGDYADRYSIWTPLNDYGATRPLYACDNCGHQQWAR